MVTISDKPGQYNVCFELLHALPLHSFQKKNQDLLILGRFKIPWLLCDLGNQDSNYRNSIDESLVHRIQHNGKTSCACYALLKFLDIIKIFVKIQTWDLLCTVTTQAEKNKERSATLVFITFCIG